MPNTSPSLDLERAFWRDGYSRVAGIDEVGRGALAGPVVAAVVIFPHVDDKIACDWMNADLFRAIARANDSKLLTEPGREKLYEPICECAREFAIGSASHVEIDALNILRASHLAMYRALEKLSSPPHALLIDALVLQDISIPQQGIVHGDTLALSIAAASIVAKVTRDRIMRELDAQFPEYHFAQNKGYGTPQHLRALEKFGPSPVHRRSYQPVAESEYGTLDPNDENRV